MKSGGASSGVSERMTACPLLLGLAWKRQSLARLSRHGLLPLPAGLRELTWRGVNATHRSLFEKLVRWKGI